MTEISDTDKRLELIPDETFLGPATEVTATVNQACMPENEPEIQAGDKWLFYLQTPWLPGQNGQENELISSCAEVELSGPLRLSYGRMSCNRAQAVPEVPTEMLLPDLLVTVNGGMAKVVGDEWKVNSHPEISDALVAGRGGLTVDLGHHLRS